MSPSYVPAETMPSGERRVRAELPAAQKRGYVAAYRILRSKEEAKEACQEAASKALAAAARFEQGAPFYPWFYRILKNHCLDRLSRRRRAPDAGGPASEPRSSDKPADAQMIEAERARAVERCVAELPAPLREIIELRHFQDMSYEEMAHALGCPPGTVMSRLYRARKELRLRLLRDPGFASPSRGRAGRDGR